MELREELAVLLRRQYEPIVEGMEPRLSIDAFDEMMKAKTEEVWPFPAQLREEAGTKGPLTEEELHIASMRASRARISSTLGKMRNLIGNRPDPRTDAVLTAMVQDGEADLKALDALDSPGVTEDQVDKVARQIVERIIQ